MTIARFLVTAALLAGLGGTAAGQDPKTNARPDPLAEAIVAFRPEFVRAPDIGLWFTRASDRGLIVADVSPDASIAKSGFQEGDQIVSVSNQRVLNETEFIRSLFAESVRSKGVKVIIVRDGKEQFLMVHPAVLIEELSVVRGDPLEPLGIVLDDRNPDRVVVWRVIPHSPAYYGGLRSGDVITAFEGRQLVSADEFTKLVLQKTPGLATAEINRGARSRLLEIDVPKPTTDRIIHPALARKPEALPRQKVDPGAIAPGGEQPRDPKVPATTPGEVRPKLRPPTAPGSVIPPPRPR